MVLDITLLFKASVKTVKVLNKAIGVSYHSPKDDIWNCSSSRPESGFSPEAKLVIANITKLKDFLLQHRKDYVNARSLISSFDLAGMTDSERDKIDRDAQIFMRTCSEAIRRLRAQSEEPVTSAQLKEHKGAVLDMVETYLKGVCKLYSEQRAIRYKRVVDKRRLSRLQPEHRSKTETCHMTASLVGEGAREKGLSLSPPSADLWGEEEEEEEGGGLEDELSPEEIQTYEQENQRLVSEMSGMADECRHIEENVVEISRLQEIFSEKVLQQEMEIDSIHQLVVGATENVKEGNEGIREAIRNNGGLRLWILFFLVMCSLCLLFLDWYSG